MLTIPDLDLVEGEKEAEVASCPWIMWGDWRESGTAAGSKGRRRSGSETGTASTESRAKKR